MADILDALFEGDKPEKDESEIPKESSLLSNCPTLLALMTWGTFKGTPRERSTLSCFLSEKEWGVRLVDTDNRRSFAMAGPSIMAAIDSLESLLVTGKVNWYYWPKVNGGGKRKKSAT